MWPVEIVIGSWLAGHERIPKNNSVLPSPLALVNVTNSWVGKSVHKTIQAHMELTPIVANNFLVLEAVSACPEFAICSCSLRKFSFPLLSLAISMSCFCLRLSKTIPNTPLRIAPIAVEPPPVRNIAISSPISPSCSVSYFVH